MALALWNKAMDSLTSAIVGIKAAETSSAIQYAVAARMLDANRAHGDAALQLIQAAEQNFENAVEDLASSIQTQLDFYA